MLTGTLVTLIGFLLCIGGGYLTANAICQRAWKEKIPQSKLIGFTAIFVTVFVVLLLIASNTVFGR